MKWLQNLESTLGNEVHKVEQAFTSETHQLFDYIKPIAESDIGKFIAAAMPLALNIVTSFVGGAGGTATRDQATAQLKDQAEKAGIAGAVDIGTSTLNFITELALQNLKVTHPVAATAAATAAAVSETPPTPTGGA